MTVLLLMYRIKFTDLTASISFIPNAILLESSSLLIILLVIVVGRAC